MTHPGKQTCIDRIRLGKKADRLGKVAGAGRIDAGIGQLPGLQGYAQLPIVTPGRLKDDMNASAIKAVEPRGNCGRSVVDTEMALKAAVEKI